MWLGYSSAPFHFVQLPGATCRNGHLLVGARGSREIPGKNILWDSSGYTVGRPKISHDLSLLLPCTFITRVQSASPASSEPGTVSQKKGHFGNVLVPPFSPFLVALVCCSAVLHPRGGCISVGHEGILAELPAAFRMTGPASDESFVTPAACLIYLLCWPYSASNEHPSVDAGRLRLQQLCSCLC